MPYEYLMIGLLIVILYQQWELHVLRKVTDNHKEFLDKHEKDVVVLSDSIVNVASVVRDILDFAAKEDKDGDR